MLHTKCGLLALSANNSDKRPSFYYDTELSRVYSVDGYAVPLATTTATGT
jgi:hypothetical protein